MKSFFVKTFLPVFFFLSALITVIQLLQSQNKEMTSLLSNPYLKVLIWSLGGCVVIFISRYLYIKYFVKNEVSQELKESSRNGVLASLYIILILFSAIILVLLFNGNPQIQMAQPKIKDSIIYHYEIVKVYDTVPVYVKIPSKAKNPSPTNSQKNDSGGSGVQNNGTNNGQQAGRDINNFGIIPRSVNNAQLSEFFSEFPNKNTHIAVFFSGNPDGEMLSVKSKILSALRSAGYTNVGDKSNTYILSQYPKDITYKKQPDGSVIFSVPPAQ